MDSSATSSIPFNSKNSLLPPNTDELSTKTPEKLPRRLRNREVRKVAAEILRPKSSRRQIQSWPAAAESPAHKPNKPAAEPIKLPEK